MYAKFRDHSYSTSYPYFEGQHEHGWVHLNLLFATHLLFSLYVFQRKIFNENLPVQDFYQQYLNICFVTSQY